MKYTDQSTVSQFISRPLSANEIALMDSYIETASKAISDYCNREWADVGIEQSAISPEERFFDVTDHKTQFVDDFLGNGAVISLGDPATGSFSALNNDTLILYPLNSDKKMSILSTDNIFKKQKSGMKIEAVFKFELPAAIKLGATMLVAGAMAQALSATQNQGLKSENIEGYSYTLQSAKDQIANDMAVLTTLDNYRKPCL